MFSTTPGSLRRVRLLLQRLEQTEDSCYDADTIEAIKNLLRDHILALEILQTPASEGGGVSKIKATTKQIDGPVSPDHLL